MSNEPKPGVIGSLPRSRPHRRSDKRPAPTGAPPLDTQAQEPAVVTAAALPKAQAAKKPPEKKPAAQRPSAKKPAAQKPRAATSRAAAAKPRAATPARPAAPSAPRESSPSGPSPGVLETAIQAAAELAEIGLHAGARTLRRVVSRLPRP